MSYSKADKGKHCFFGRDLNLHLYFIIELKWIAVNNAPPWCIFKSMIIIIMTVFYCDWLRNVQFYLVKGKNRYAKLHVSAQSDFRDPSLLMAGGGKYFADSTIKKVKKVFTQPQISIKK
jgi:hypothetical protein